MKCDCLEAYKSELAINVQEDTGTAPVTVTCDNLITVMRRRRRGKGRKLKDIAYTGLHISFTAHLARKGAKSVKCEKFQVTASYCPFCGRLTDFGEEIEASLAQTRAEAGLTPKTTTKGQS